MTQAAETGRSRKAAKNSDTSGKTGAAVAGDEHGRALEPVGAMTQERMTALIERAQRGDAKAMGELRPVLARAPEWEKDYTGPAAQARRMLLEATLGDNLLVREAWERRASALQRELEGPNCTPLEHILCGRVTTCWLDVHLADVTFAAKYKGNMTLGQLTFYQARQDRANKRYLAAVESLARVRRLLRPGPLVAQMNIAQPGANQLNVAAMATQVRAAPAAPSAIEN